MIIYMGVQVEVPNNFLVRVFGGLYDSFFRKIKKCTE